MSFAPHTPHPWMNYPHGVGDPEWCGQCDEPELCPACGDQGLASSPAQEYGQTQALPSPNTGRGRRVPTGKPPRSGG